MEDLSWKGPSEEKNGNPVLSLLTFLKAARIAENIQHGPCRRLEADLVHIFFHGAKFLAEGLKLAIARQCFINLLRLLLRSLLIYIFYQVRLCKNLYHRLCN